MTKERFRKLERQSLFEEPLPVANPPVALVKAARIRFAPGQPTGLHRHPISTCGVVTEGSFLFQTSTGQSRTLHVGDAFFEPAGENILHFDNASRDEPAEIVCFYLVDDSKTQPIEMLEGGMEAQLGTTDPR